MPQLRHNSKAINSPILPNTIKLIIFTSLMENRMSLIINMIHIIKLIKLYRNKDLIL